MSTNPYESPKMFDDQFQAPSNMPAPLPAAAIVFGILHLTFAVLGLCGLVFSSIAFFLPTNPEALAQNPALKLMHENQAFRLFNMFGIGIGFIATLVLFVAGVGLIMRKSFGRTLSIGYGWYGIVMSFVGLLVNVLVLFPALFEAIENAPPGPAKAGAIGGIIGGVLGGVLGFVYPSLVLFFMYRPNMIAAFAPEKQP